MTRTKTTLAIAAMIAVMGCGNGAAPVDKGKARAALVAALDAWKRGETPGALQTAAPPITVQDVDWMSGFKLDAYELVGDGKDDTLNLRCPVKLSLHDPQGKAVERQVTYQVGTSPVTTVFREFKM